MKELQEIAKVEVDQNVRKFSFSTIVNHARLLKSEKCENPEYDRALCEILSSLTGTEIEEVEVVIGIRSTNKR